MSHRSLFFRALSTTCLVGGVAFMSLGCGPAPVEGTGVKGPEGGSHPLLGQAAPAFTAEAVTGEGPKTVAEASGKVLIVDFWATYCDPCKKSFPKYQELVEQFGGDLAVIGVSVDEKGDASKETIEEFAKTTGVKFSLVWDTEKTAAKAYSPPNMPTSYVIDKTGVVRHVHAKYQVGEEAAIAEEVKALLGK